MLFAAARKRSVLAVPGQRSLGEKCHYLKDGGSIQPENSNRDEQPVLLLEPGSTVADPSPTFCVAAIGSIAYSASGFGGLPADYCLHSFWGSASKTVS